MLPSERTQLGLGDWIALVLLILLWLCGSSMDIEKYAGGHASTLLVLGTVTVGLLLYALWSPSFKKSSPSIYYFVFVWALVAIAYSVIHPIASEHVLTQGNDSEDALYRGSLNLLHGHFPYYSKTYLNNPITPMPGALALDVPFAGMGFPGVQNLFWLGIFIIFCLTYFKTRKAAFVCLLLVLANAHTFVNWMTGADYPTNCLYMCVSVFWFVTTIKDSSLLQRSLSACLLGFTLSSRLTYLLIIPLLLAAYLVQELGVSQGLLRLMAPLAITALVSGPFYFYDPHNFSPLHVANFLSAMTPAHQHTIFAVLTLTAVGISLSAFFSHLTFSRLYLLAALSTGVILLPPGVVVAFHQHFSVQGLLVLGYTDTAYIFLCLWICYRLESGGIDSTDRSHNRAA